MNTNSSASILVIDPGWVGFQQLTLRLDRLGVDALYVDLDRGASKRLRDRLWFRHAVQSTLGELPALLASLDTSAVRDIICPEDLIDDILAAATTAGLPEEALADLRLRARWADKACWPEELAGTGLKTPVNYRLGGIASADVEKLVGLPFLLKPRTGAGGDGIEVVRDLDRAREVLDAPVAGFDGVMVQPYLEGEVCQYVAAYRGDEILLDSMYVSTSRSVRSLGPGAEGEVIDDPVLRDVGRRFLAHLGGRGLANVETIRTADGTHWIIDINLRPWGLFGAYVLAGYPFDEEYVRSLGLTPHVGAGAGHDSAVVAAREDRLEVFPMASRGRLPLGVRAVADHFRGSAPKASADFGAPYVAWSGLGMAVLAAKARRERSSRASA